MSSISGLTPAEQNALEKGSWTPTGRKRTKVHPPTVEVTSRGKTMWIPEASWVTFLSRKNARSNAEREGTANRSPGTGARRLARA